MEQKKVRGIVPPSRAFKQIKSNCYEATEFGFLEAARRLNDTGYISNEQLIDVETKYRELQEAKEHNKKMQELSARVKDIDSRIAECNEQVIISRNLSIMVQLGIDDVTPKFEGDKHVN